MKMISVLMAAASCSQRLVDLTVASTKNMDINNTRGYVTTNNVRSSGSDMSHVILWIPCGTPDIKEAMDKAIEKTVANA